MQVLDAADDGHLRAVCDLLGLGEAVATVGAVDVAEAGAIFDEERRLAFGALVRRCALEAVVGAAAARLAVRAQVVIVCALEARGGGLAPCAVGDLRIAGKALIRGCLFLQKVSRFALCRAQTVAPNGTGIELFGAAFALAFGSVVDLPGLVAVDDGEMPALVDRAALAHRPVDVIFLGMQGAAGGHVVEDYLLGLRCWRSGVWVRRRLRGRRRT